MLLTVLLKYGRPVANATHVPSIINWATQDPIMDGPYGDLWNLEILQRIFQNESGHVNDFGGFCASGSQP